MKFSTKFVMLASFMAVVLPSAASAEVGGYVSIGAIGSQTKSTYQGGLLFPLSFLDVATAPAVGDYLDPGFVGATKSQAGVRLEAGYDFFFINDYYVGAFGQIDTAGTSGGNAPKIVGGTQIIPGIVNGQRLFRQVDNRFQIATEAKLGPSYTLGLTFGRNFDQLFVAANVGFSFADADLAYGAAFDVTRGLKNGFGRGDLPLNPDSPIISKSSEKLNGVSLGLEVGYSLNESWDIVANGSTVDYGKVAVDSPAGGSKLAVGFKSTRGGITLRRRF